jgi:hypothetical protein
MQNPLRAAKAAVLATVLLAMAHNASADETKTTTRVAVHKVTGEDDARRAMLLRHSLLAELGKLEGVDVHDALAPDAAPGGETTCPGEELSCLARLAQALGAEEVVLGNMAQMDHSRMLVLKRVRIADGEVVGATTKRVTGDDGEGLLLTLGKAVEELYPEHTVKAGLTRGVPEEVMSRWSPPPLRPIVVWTGVALTVAAAGTAAGFGIAKTRAEDDFNAYAKSSAQTSGSHLRELEDKAHDRTSAANYALGATAVLAVGTAVAALFTDWRVDPDWLVVPVAGTGSQGGLTMSLAGRWH